MVARRADLVSRGSSERPQWAPRPLRCDITRPVACHIHPSKSHARTPGWAVWIVVRQFPMDFPQGGCLTGPNLLLLFQAGVGASVRGLAP
jgi:hypothetical protein